MWTYFSHSFFVANESNQSISYAANFGSCFLGSVFARWSSSYRASLFLMFEVVDDTDNVFNTTDNNNGDNNKKRPVDKQEDNVEGVEHTKDNGDNDKKGPSTNEGTTSKGWNTPMNQRGQTHFFFVNFNTNLPTIVFLMGSLMFFVMLQLC